MRGMKRYQGRMVLISTGDGGAVRGTAWRVARDGIELRNATDMHRQIDLSGFIWIPADQVRQVQIVAEVG